MKTSLRTFLVCLALGFASVSQAQTYSLVPLTTFGPNGDGSIRPLDQPWVDTLFNQRGLACDPTTTNLVFVDTHTGSAGSATVAGSIFILDGTYGTNISTLDTNGINGGSYADAPAAVADDGVVYVANQVTVSTAAPLKIYRWDSTSSTNPPVVAFSSTLTPPQRYGVSIDVRGAGTNTQIIMGSTAQNGGTGTNVLLFTTTDGTNFSVAVLATDVTSPNFLDGVAFGSGNTFWAKQVNAPLRLMSFDLSTSNAVTLKAYTTANLLGSEHLGALSVDTNRNLLAALEQAGGIVNGGPERVWLYDISDLDRGPVLLDIKEYIANFQNATAPPGYLDFGGGRLYSYVVNNGLVAYSVDSIAVPAPIIVRQPAATNRLATGQTLTLAVLAYPAISYQWQSNGVNIAGATNSIFILPNVQPSYAATYNVVLSNAGGSTNASSVLAVVNPADLFHLNLLWRVSSADTLPWLNNQNSAVPNQRTIAYNAHSNHLYVVSRSSNTTSNYVIYALDANTGALVHTLNTNGIFNAGAVGAGGIGLVGIDVADDGAIYICNESPNAYGNGGAIPEALFRVYRWANGDSNTTPVEIFSGDPSGLSAVLRWGDNLTVRGSGTNTQILIDSNTRITPGNVRYAAILSPSGPNLNSPWTSQWIIGTNSGTAIGKSLTFDGTNNAIWQKVFNGSLIKTSFDPSTIVTPGTYPQISASVLAAYSNFSNRLAGVALDFTRNLAIGVHIPTAAVADTLALYEISNPNAPLILAEYAFPVNPHNANGNFITQTLIKGNKVFSLDANNGIMAFTIATGPLNPPIFVTQPQNLRLMVGGSGQLTAAILESGTFQWQKSDGVTFTNIPGQTNSSLPFVNAQFSDGANYRVIASNPFSGSTTSSVAAVTIFVPEDQYSLSQIWGSVVNSQPYIMGAASGVPNTRTIAYNPLSNHLYVVTRSSSTTSNFVIHVVNADDGTPLWELNTNGIYNAGAVGEGGIGLVGIDVADDGSIYICNEAPDACGCGPGVGPEPADSLFRVYRWADGNSNTLPVQIFAGDPAGANGPVRWGDNLTVRGGGTNTEILLDPLQGNFGAILKPTDEYLTNFTSQFFGASVQSTAIGRSLEFGSTNTLWQKRRGTPLRLSSYNLLAQNSTTLANYGNFPATLGQAALQLSRNLMVGLDYNGIPGSSPDNVSLYEISDFDYPLLIAQYAFPTNQQPNGNFIGQLLFAGNRVFALNANNGLVSFRINGPQLNAIRSGNDVVISWTTNLAGQVLQSTPSLSPASWTDVTNTVTIVGSRYTVTDDTGGSSKFYRLRN